MKVKELLESLYDCDDDADVFFVGRYTNPVVGDGVEPVCTVYEMVDRAATEEPCAGVYLRGDS